MRKARESLRKKDFEVPSFMQHKYAAPKRQVHITRIMEPVQKMVCDFFMVNTHVISGAKRKTRVLAMKWFEVMAELHARWPALLRKLAKDRPDPRWKEPRAQ